MDISRKRKVDFVVFVVIAIKLIIFFWASANFNFTAFPADDMLSIWDRWDSNAYKTIAQTGYNFVNITPDYWAFLSHFLPLYPFIIRMVAGLFRITLTQSGLFISFISIIAASIFLYKLAFSEFRSAKIAMLAVVAMNLYPASYFSIGLYAESLFLFLAIFSFYCLKKEYYFWCGVSGALAILTRFTGVVFIPVFAAYFVYQWKRSGFKVRSLYPFFLSLVGLAVYLGINKIYYGDYFYFFKETLSFNATKHLMFPFQETYWDLIAVFRDSNFWDQAFMMSRGWNALFTVAALGITAVGLYKINWVYSLFSLGSILMFASLSWGISNARYTFGVFPIFLVLARCNKKTLAILLPACGFGLLYFTYVYTSGAWAF